MSTQSNHKVTKSQSHQVAITNLTFLIHHACSQNRSKYVGLCTNVSHTSVLDTSNFPRPNAHCFGLEFGFGHRLGLTFRLCDQPSWLVELAWVCVAVRAQKRAALDVQV